MVVGNGHTVRIKRSVKLRVINELESYPSVLNEIRPQVIAQMIVRYMERLTEKERYLESREIAEKIRNIEIMYN